MRDRLSPRRTRYSASRHLLDVALGGRDRRQHHVGRGPQRVPRDAQRVAGRDQALPAPHAVYKREVRGAQRIERDAEGGRQRGRPVVAGEHRDLGVLRRVAGQLSEVALGVLLDLERRQELRVEVPRREAEAAALVAVDDRGHVARAELAHGPLHAADAVVVAGERERPGVRALVVRREQPGGGDGGEPGVVALVDHVVDAHVDAAGGARELPEPGGADVRARRRVERRLDVRQRGELDRHAPLGEDAAHVALPAALPDHSRAELVRLAELEAHLAGGPPQRGVADAAREQAQHTALLGVEVAAPAGSRGAAARPGSAPAARAGSAPGRAGPRPRAGAPPRRSARGLRCRAAARRRCRLRCRCASRIRRGARASATSGSPAAARQGSGSPGPATHAARAPGRAGPGLSAGRWAAPSRPDRWRRPGARAPRSAGRRGRARRRGPNRPAPPRVPSRAGTATKLPTEDASAHPSGGSSPG